jgi:hypothetical protein
VQLPRLLRADEHILLSFSSTKAKIVLQFFGGYGIIAYLCNGSATKSEFTD